MFNIPLKYNKIHNIYIKPVGLVQNGYHNHYFMECNMVSPWYSWKLNNKRPQPYIFSFIEYAVSSVLDLFTYVCFICNRYRHWKCWRKQNIQGLWTGRYRNNSEAKQGKIYDTMNSKIIRKSDKIKGGMSFSYFNLPQLMAS